MTAPVLLSRSCVNHLGRILPPSSSSTYAAAHDDARLPTLDPGMLAEGLTRGHKSQEYQWRGHLPLVMVAKLVSDIENTPGGREAVNAEWKICKGEDVGTQMKLYPWVSGKA